jgi:hypothetical protein
MALIFTLSALTECMGIFQSSRAERQSVDINENKNTDSHGLRTQIVLFAFRLLNLDLFPKQTLGRSSKEIAKRVGYPPPSPA